MKLTPLDIRKHEFSRRMRGYDADEVQAYLNLVSSQWSEIVDGQRRAEERVRELESKLEHYERVEEALQEALKTARENSRESENRSRQQSERIVGQAKDEASTITSQARGQKQKLEQEVDQLESRRNEVVARLRAFLMSEMEMLAHYDGSDPTGFIKLLPSEPQGMNRLSAPHRAPEPRSEIAEPEPEPSSPEPQPEEVALEPPPAPTAAAEPAAPEPAPGPESDQAPRLSYGRRTVLGVPIPTPSPEPTPPTARPPRVSDKLDEQPQEDEEIARIRRLLSGLGD